MIYRSNMEGFNTALEHLAEQVKKYRNTSIKVHSGEQLNEILKQLSATLYYLEGERAKYHEQFQDKINTLVFEGSTVARAENQAHKDIPELYMLRRIMDAGYEVIGAIRSNLSWLKSEKQSTQGT